ERSRPRTRAGEGSSRRGSTAGSVQREGWATLGAVIIRQSTLSKKGTTRQPRLVGEELLSPLKGVMGALSLRLLEPVSQLPSLLARSLPPLVGAGRGRRSGARRSRRSLGAPHREPRLPRLPWAGVFSLPWKMPRPVLG